ncbi:helix-turn-helix transcriptional regulator [Streptomyces sp. NPDC101160]|uniref:helix-turn-helix transcriptional regulator n=1 Tax=Streptomyces sp. NPDC101160 TaxID=3366118 RepID=UPI00381E9732
MLRVLGLESGTEAVYRLMLEHPSWGVDRLAEALDTDRPTVTAALDRLADLALLRSAATAGTPCGASRLVPPRAGLGALLEQRQAELARTQMEIDASRAAVADLIADYTALGRNPEAGGVERFTGADAVHRLNADLTAQAHGEFLALAPTTASGDGPWEIDVPLHLDLLARGVRVRVLHLDSTDGTPERRRAVRQLAQAGAEIRTLPALPLHLRIVDGTSAVLPLDPHEPAYGAVLLREPGALAGLRALFTYLWDEATPLTDADADADGEAGEPGAYSPQERALLRFLAEGLTDEAAARRLGISLRSERRMISGLAERLRAHSRFQLGLQAARSGLV